MPHFERNATSHVTGSQGKTISPPEQPATENGNSPGSGPIVLDGYSFAVFRLGAPRSVPPTRRAVHRRSHSGSDVETSLAS